MDTKNLNGLMEAYSEVYAPEQLDEASSRDEFTRAAIARSSGRKGGITFEPGPNWDPSANRGKGAHLSPKQKEKQRRKALRQEELDIFDVVLEFLQVEGYAETLEEAEWLMANVIDEEEIDIILGEAIYSEKGKAKAAEMIAKRSTPSGRAKPGKGANVAQIRQIRGSGRGRFDREGLGGTPMTPTMAKNPIKKQNYDGTGNKAARRAAALKKEDFEFWVNSLVEEGYDLSEYTWEEMYDVYEAENHFLIKRLNQSK